MNSVTAAAARAAFNAIVHDAQKPMRVSGSCASPVGAIPPPLDEPSPYSG